MRVLVNIFIDFGSIMDNDVDISIAVVKIINDIEVRFHIRMILNALLRASSSLQECP